MSKIIIDANVECENDVWHVDIEAPRWLLDELSRKAKQQLSVGSTERVYGIGKSGIGKLTISFGKPNGSQGKIDTTRNEDHV